MHCLTDLEQRKWLSNKGIIETPYTSDKFPLYYIRICPPTDIVIMLEFMRSICEFSLQEESVLLTVVDWSAYIPHEMRLFHYARLAYGERRHLKESPGHVFSHQELEDLILLFSLTIDFHWQSYLYFGGSKITLLNWEGAILSFWSGTGGHAKSFNEVVTLYNLEDPEIKEAKQFLS